MELHGETPWNTALLQKLMVAQLVKISLTSYHETATLGPVRSCWNLVHSATQFLQHPF
jgi:hypothetical protein